LPYELTKELTYELIYELTNHLTKELLSPCPIGSTTLARRRDSRQILLIMPFKRRPTPDEIDVLADEFRPLWRDGDVVRPWLRTHAMRLRSLIADGWSWAGLATVLTQAGITYRTRRPWTVNALKAEVSRANAPLKAYKSTPRDVAAEMLRPSSFGETRPMMSGSLNALDRSGVFPKFAPARIAASTDFGGRRGDREPAQAHF
jgi:hypothetical protein